MSGRLADISKNELFLLALDDLSQNTFADISAQEIIWRTAINEKLNTLIDSLNTNMQAAARRRMFSLTVTCLVPLQRAMNLCADGYVRDTKSTSFEEYLLGKSIPNILRDQGLPNVFTITRLDIDTVPAITFLRCFNISWGAPMG